MSDTRANADLATLRSVHHGDKDTFIRRILPGGSREAQPGAIIIFERCTFERGWRHRSAGNGCYSATRSASRIQRFYQQEARILRPLFLSESRFDSVEQGCHEQGMRKMEVDGHGRLLTGAGQISMAFDRATYWFYLHWNRYTTPGWTAQAVAIRNERESRAGRLFISVHPQHRDQQCLAVSLIRPVHLDSQTDMSAARSYRYPFIKCSDPHAQWLRFSFTGLCTIAHTHDQPTFR